MRTTQRERDGLTCTAVDAGPESGMPVLLLHGWGGSSESMRGVLTGLAGRGYRVYALDLPGFGSSTLPSAVWGVPEYARFVAAYMKDLPHPQVHLIGHSFGGRISIVLGADYAAGVDKIVLTSSAGVLTPPSGLKGAAVSLGKAALKLPGLNRFEGPLRRMGSRALGSDDLREAGPLEPIFRQVVTQDLVPYAARIGRPTLLIWGDQDDQTPLWQAQTLEKAIPDSGLVVFNGAGHFAYQERLPDFLRIVDTFFGSK